MAFGMYEAINIALFHALGDFPKPEFTHEFYRGGPKWNYRALPESG